jgi:adenylate kinase
MTHNKLYYLVGLAGAGKTAVCKQLATSVEDGVAVQTSGRFMDFIKQEGINKPEELDLISSDDRELLVNGLHHSLADDKDTNAFTFSDGHMLVENTNTGLRVNAMASVNKGISTGILFLNTPSDLIFNNIRKDNASSVRRRKGVSIPVLQNLAEDEFQAAEDYCIENSIEFGVLNNLDPDFAICKTYHDDVRYLNSYYLPASFELRDKYKAQFCPSLSPSVLRKQHYEIGEMLLAPFAEKEGLENQDCQVLSIPRSGNFIANGFAANFDGRLLMSKDPSEVSDQLDYKKPLLIIDSVIDSGNTVCKIVNGLPASYTQPIHVICLAINIKSLDVIESFKHKVSFHCLGFSNKEGRPTGLQDMGARLYGTPT